MMQKLLRIVLYVLIVVFALVGLLELLAVLFLTPVHPDNLEFPELNWGKIISMIVISAICFLLAFGCWKIAKKLSRDAE